MISPSWFWAATVAGLACAALALLVMAAGWRRRLPEVTVLGTALLAVSVMAGAYGMSISAVGGGPPISRWAGVLGLPLGIAVAIPLLFPARRLGRTGATRWRAWVTAWAMVATAVAASLLRVDARPPALVTAAAVGLGSVGSLALARRQLLLYRISRRPPALIATSSIIAVAAASIGALGTEPGSTGSWILLATENLGVLAAGIAIIAGYRTGAGVADVLGPILSREPLAALEIGMSPELHAFVAALDRKDRITRDHVVRTSALAMRVAIRAGLPAPTVRDIALGALLHDLGKLVIPSEIVSKPGSLTDDEFATIRTHPEQGELLLRGAPSLAGAAPYVRGHHERVDGCGYPDGLGGAAVTLEVGLVSVVDAWDAMTHTRHYRERMSLERAGRILRDGAGTQWRADAVELVLAEVNANGQVDLTQLAAVGDRAATADAAAPAAAASLRSRVFEASPLGMGIIDADGRFVEVNPALAALVGHQATDLIGSSLASLLAPDDRERASDSIGEVRRTATAVRTSAERLVTRAGETLVVDLAMSVIDGLPTGTCVLLQIVDVTERYRRNVELETLALVDDLTGIANRRGFCLQARAALGAVERDPGGAHLIYVDVDGLKEINDTLGHAGGDEALRTTAKVLSSVSRAGDVIGRLGGDEFAVLIPSGPPNQADRIVARIHDATRALDDALAAGLQLSTGVASVGPDEALGIDDLLARADRAMYSQRRKADHGR